MRSKGGKGRHDLYRKFLQLMANFNQHKKQNAITISIFFFNILGLVNYYSGGNPDNGAVNNHFHSHYESGLAKSAYNLNL